MSHAPHTDGDDDDDAKRDGMALTHKGEWDRVQKVESVLERAISSAQNKCEVSADFFDKLICLQLYT